MLVSPGNLLDSSMLRHPEFDPPEYLGWEPDASLVREYADLVRSDPERHSLITALGPDDLLRIYEDLVRARVLDVVLARWVHERIIPDARLATGEEAVTVGSVTALDRSRDVLSPGPRNAGALPMMGIPLADLFRSQLGLADSPTGGRELPFGDPERGVIQPAARPGVTLSVMAGVALGFRSRGENRVALTWVGDGALRTAAFHEAINFAAVQHLPLVVVVQDNQVAGGTLREHHSPGAPRWVAEAYGLPSWVCDGNHVLDVFAAAGLAVRRARAGQGPAVVVAETFRMAGDSVLEAQRSRQAIPAEHFVTWGKREPVGLFEAFLKGAGVPEAALEDAERRVAEDVEGSAREALAGMERMPAGSGALFEGVSEGGPGSSLAKRPL